MTTPELTIAEQMQITKWEILANRYYQSDDSVYEGDDAEHCYKMGYLRAKEETEQIMKLAKFGADCIANAPPQIIAKVAQSHGLMFTGEFDWEIEPNIESTIKGILK